MDPSASPAAPAGTAPAPDDTFARRYASGRQYELRRGDALAVVTELAAGLRLYSRGGTALTETYADDEISPGAAGIMLAPWANRIEDGIWYLDGKKQQLDITEVSHNNASHGLLRNAAYELVDESEFSITLEAAVFPQHGYPFLLRHRVRYGLDESLGLTVSQTLINDSQNPAPFVLGAHPYLRIDGVRTEDLTVTVNGGTRLVTDERQIPRGTEPAGGDFDLRSGRLAGELDLDSAYTDLTADDDGVIRSTLSAPDGRSVSLWQDAQCRYVHVFVTDKLPGRTKAVALEPMTGPANAFNSGDGLRWLPAGERFTMTWGISADLGG